MHQIPTRRTAIGLSVASALALLAGPAAAQEPQSAQSAQEPQTVMVTATRFSSSLLKTPLAVTAITQEALQDKGVSNLIDLNNQIPNVQIVEAGAAGQPNVVIRGITGTTTSIEIGEGAVGFHVDGIFQPRPQAAKALMFDLKQVEVLRGPQGTLFGRNSTAGSINVIPEKPDFSGNYGNTSFEMGTQRLRNVTVVHNLAVNDRLAFRVAANRKTRDSYLNQLQDFTAGPSGKNSAGADFNYPVGVPLVDQRYNVQVDPSKYYNAVEQTAVRLGGLLKAAPNFTVGATYEWYDNPSPGFQLTQDCSMGEGTRYACRLPQDTILVNVPGEQKNAQRNANIRLNWTVSDVTQIDFVSSYTSLRRNSHTDGSVIHPFPFNVNYVFRSNEIDAATGLYKSAYGVNGCTTSLCTYPVNDAINTLTDSNFVSRVQELQLKQSWKGFRYVSGLFWMHEKNRNFSANENMVGNTAFASPNFGNFFSQVNRTIDSKAVFSQADWDFAPSWTATLGARYTRDRRTDADGIRWDGGTGPAVQNAYYQGVAMSPAGYNLGLKAGQPGWRPHTGLDLTNAMGVYHLGEAAAAAPFGKPAFPLAAYAADWSRTTWRAGLKKDLDKNSMVYASWSTGYKAGGFNDIIDYCGGRTCASGATPDLRFPIWQPETVTNFELGYKGRITDKLTFSAALFRQNYNDLQQSISTPGAVRLDPQCSPVTDTTCDPVAKTSIASIFTTTNVGRLSIPGAELEWTYRPWQGFSWSGFTSYLDARMHGFDQLTDNFMCAQRAETGTHPCPAPSTSANPLLKGKRLISSEGKRPPNSPRRTFASTLSQRLVMDNGLVLVPRVGMRWQDKVYFDLTNLEDPHFGKFQKAYAKFDMGMRINTRDDVINFDVAVRNASDVRARTSATNGPNGTDGAIMASYIEPRVYSVRMTVKY